MKRQSVFTLIACCIPFLVLGALELGLRVLNYGQSVPVFVDASKLKGYQMVNPDLIKRFFHLNTATPKVSPDTVYFKTEKQPDTIRIVLMGGSTAAGFPYGRFGSPAGLLTHQLRAVYPEKNIEVIPVAMASINSYALRDMADEVAAISPDAVLVYAGHNEYLGVMGIGSAFAHYGSHGTNLLFLALKDSRVFQLVQQLIVPSSSARTNDSVAAGRTTMAIMAKEQNIPFDSDLYHGGISQFTDNLQALVNELTNADIPVFVGDLVANEKDQKPFVSADPDGFKGIEQYTNNAPRDGKALAELDDLFATAPSSANLAFTKGTLLYARNKRTDSIALFTQASDYDLLRFRAPSAFNQVIHELSESPSLYIVNLQRLFREDAEGPIGERLMLEHLHPTLRGYFVMADGFLTALVNNGLLPSPSYPLEKTYTHRFKQIPLNDIDKGVAEFKIARLKSDYPFVDKPVNVDRPSTNVPFSQWINSRLDGEPWLVQQQKLVTHFQRKQQWLDAANSAALLFEAIPDQSNNAAIAAKLYLKANQPRLAWYYARKASDDTPDDANLLLTLAESQYWSEDNQAAKATLERILAFDPANQRAAFYLKQLKTQ